MNPARKTAGLGILFLLVVVCIRPLSAHEEPIPDGESPSGEELLLDEETLLSEEPPLDEEILFSEKLPLDEESPLREEPPFDEEYLLGEEYPPDEETLLSEEPPLDDDSLFSEEYPDDGSLVFEAPSLIFEVPPFIYETRSFNEIFSGLSRIQKRMAMNDEGLRYSFEKNDSPMLIPDPDSGIDLFSSVMKRNPSHIFEILHVVPYNEKELDMLDIYNAIGRIENIKDYTIPLRNGDDFYIFVESTRLESAQNRKSVSDPPPAHTLPYSETMYLRLKEAYFGNLYLRGDVSTSLYGITYSITNFTDVRYFLIPVLRTERFSAVIYLEPVKEGVLVYCMSGLYIPGFVASSINLTPGINARISVLIDWLIDGLRRQEIITAEPDGEALEITDH